MNRKKKLDLDPDNFYRTVARQWAIHDEPGLTLLLVARKCLQEMSTHEATIAEQGALVADRFGQLRPNPACQLLKESRAHFLQSVKALALDLETLNAKDNEADET